jgi:transcriptional regulator with XRE-family HTH domain
MTENGPEQPRAPAKHPSSKLFVGFGERLRALRTKAGLTQGKLARQVGATNIVVSKHETGYMMPSAHLLQRYAECLGVEPAYLQYGVGSPDSWTTLMDALRATDAPFVVQRYCLKNPLKRAFLPDVWLELLRQSYDFWECLGGEDIDDEGVDSIAVMIDHRLRKRLSYQDGRAQSGRAPDGNGSGKRDALVAAGAVDASDSPRVGA